MHQHHVNTSVTEYLQNIRDENNSSTVDLDLPQHRLLLDPVKHSQLYCLKSYSYTQLKNNSFIRATMVKWDNDRSL